MIIYGKPTSGQEDDIKTDPMGVACEVVYFIIVAKDNIVTCLVTSHEVWIGNWIY
jgi:hypothetical protein